MAERIDNKQINMAPSIPFYRRLVHSIQAINNMVQPKISPDIDSGLVFL